jgi:hypothetical protein
MTPSERATLQRELETSLSEAESLPWNDKTLYSSAWQFRYETRVERLC